MADPATSPERNSYYHLFGLEKNPFEAQGEFDPDVSLEVSPLRTEELRRAREIIKMAAHDHKLIVAVIVGEPATGKTYLAKKISRGEGYSTDCKHVYLKLGIGPSTNHLYILGMIVSKLKQELDRLPAAEVRKYLDAQEDVFRNPIAIEGAIGQESLEAARLLNDWYTYVAALRELGKYHSLAIFLDEVEDRWGVKGVPAIQREEDLIYLRDLIGFVQDEKGIAGKFPVALFLCMTAETYVQIGSDNNALQTRLQRTINLRRFTQDEAKLLAKEKLKTFRMTPAADFYPFTEEAIDYMLKKAVAGDFFNFRKFLIDSYDSLYYFAQSFSIRGGKPGLIDHRAIVEWYTHRGESVQIEVPKGEEYVEGLQIIDVKIAKDPEAQRTWQRLRKELAGKPGLQYKRALDSVRNLFTFASPDQFAPGSGVTELIVKIPDARAQVPVQVRNLKDGKDTGAEGFVLYVSDEKSDGSFQSNEALLVLPREQLPLFAIFGVGGLLPAPAKEDAVRIISKDISQILERIHEYFEQNRKSHYIPHVLLTYSKKIETLANELGRYLGLGEKSGVSKAKLMEMDLSNGVALKDPYWLPLLTGFSPEDADELRKKQFFFNLESAPVKVGLMLLETVGLLEDGKQISLDRQKATAASQCEQWRKSIETKLSQIDKDLGGTSPPVLGKLVEDSCGQLDELRAEIVSYKQRAGSLLENSVALYNKKTKASSIWSSTSEQLDIKGAAAKKFGIVLAGLDGMEGSLKSQRFNWTSLAKPIKDLRKRLSARLQGDWARGEAEFEADYAVLGSQIQSFEARSRSIEDKIQDTKVKEIEKAIKRGFLPSERDIESDWSTLTNTTDIEQAEKLVEQIEAVQNRLREKASEYLTALRQKQANAYKIVSQLERYVKREKMGKAAAFAKSIEDRLGQAYKYFQEGAYAEVLNVDIEKEYAQIQPALRTLFDDKESYTVKDVSKKFDISAEEATEFVRALEKNGILEAYYRVVSGKND